MPRRKTLKKFIRESGVIHNNKYNYSKFIYINNKVKGIIICPIHGDFFQEAHGHLKGYGCSKCAGNNKILFDEWIEKCNKKHIGKYDYSWFVFKNLDSKSIIICPNHGLFNQQARIHIQGHGCRICYFESRRITKQQFINKSNKIHYFKYDYSKFEFINTRTEGIIICPIHGDFLQLPSNHMAGSSCDLCGNESIRLSKCFENDEFIQESKKVHGNKYDYSKVIYGKNNSEKVIIICKKHGNFEQIAGNHLKGSGCSLCKNKNEEKIWHFLKNNNINFIYQYKVMLSINKKLPNKVDFFIHNLNLFIEYNGRQHYEPVRFGGISQKAASESFEKQQIRDQQLREYCKNNNINILEIDGRIYSGPKLVKFLYSYFFNIIFITNSYK